MNVSPATLLTDEFAALFGRVPVERVLLELSEHDQVEDYDTLRTTLAPLRERGMRLAIDDGSADFSSLRHIVLTAPDVIKLERSLVDGTAHPRPVAGRLRPRLRRDRRGRGRRDGAGRRRPAGARRRPRAGLALRQARPGYDLVPCPPRETLPVKRPARTPRAAAPTG